MRRGQRGQSAVEVVALVPLLLVLAAVAWAGIAATLAWVDAVGGARAGARAAEVGAPAEEAAGAVLAPRDGEVTAVAGAAGTTQAVRVEVDVPLGRGWRLEAEREVR